MESEYLKHTINDIFIRANHMPVPFVFYNFMLLMKSKLTIIVKTLFLGYS